MNIHLHEKLNSMMLPIKLDALGLFFINFLIPIVAHQNFDANGWQMGVLFSLQALGTGCSALLFSKRVNKWKNRAELIFIGSTIKAISYIALYFAIISKQYELMVIATFGLGFGSGMFWLIWQTCFAQLSAYRNRAEVLGEATKQIGTGILIGSIIAFTVLSLAEENNIVDHLRYMVILGFFVASSIAGYLAYKAVNAMSINDVVEASGVPSTLKITIISVFVFGLIFIGQLSGSLVAPFLEVYLLEHLKITTIGELSIAYIPGGIISLMVAPKLGKFADGINPALFLGGASLVGAVTTWFMLQATELYQISILFVIDASVITSAGLVLSKLISEVAGEEKGTAFGIQGFVTNFGAISGPFLGGIFWELNGAKGPLIFSIGTETFLAICCVAILMPALRKSSHFAELSKTSSNLS